jgi:hypothetical protein
VCSLARHNYNIEKRQRELKKQQKQEEKRQRRLERKAADAPADANPGDTNDPERPAEV